MKKTILVVDDMKINVSILETLLKEKYNILSALDGENALNIANTKIIDLILLDISMHGMDGFEVIKELKDKEYTKNIPVIFITSKMDEETIEQAYKLGGVDYITKPFRKREVLSRISTHLSLSEQKAMLEKKVEEKTKKLYTLNEELILTQKEIVFTLGMIGEKRCKETGNHVKRVAIYSEILARGYGLNHKSVKILKEASIMHDIGKVAIADAILNKVSGLTQEEFEIMKTHTIHGYDMLKYSKRELLQAGAIIAYQHHERWDGTGYPQGLKGTQIHIYGRITAIADVFDALGSDRVYKKAWDDEKIFDLFNKERGKHFEPKLVDLFFDNLDEILKVRESLRDNF